MANSLNLDLEGQVVVLKKATNDKAYQDLRWLVVRALGAFGAKAQTHGITLLVLHLEDGEMRNVSGYDVERLATESDLAALTPESRARWEHFDPFAPTKK